MNTNTAAVAAGMCRSYKKKATTITMEMMSGASTMAEPHPAVDPDVTANMKRIMAAV